MLLYEAEVKYNNTYDPCRIDQMAIARFTFSTSVSMGSRAHTQMFYVYFKHLSLILYKYKSIVFALKFYFKKKKKEKKRSNQIEIRDCIVKLINSSM